MKHIVTALLLVTSFCVGLAIAAYCTPLKDREEAQKLVDKKYNALGYNRIPNP